MSVLKPLLSKLICKRLYALPFVFFSIFLICAYKYVQKYFTTMSASEFLFFINTPLEGADKRLIHVFINKCLVNPLIYSILICYATEIISLPFNILKKQLNLPAFLKIVLQKVKKYETITLITLSVLVLIFYLPKFWFLKELFAMHSATYDTFYEQHFVQPAPQNIQFPHKKNLIVIVVESLEETFKNKDFFGQSLIPHLEQLEAEGVKFTNFQNGWSTTYTAASIMALFSGVPTNVIGKYFVNTYGKTLNFLPEYYSLGNILQSNSYQTYSVQGSGGRFSGLENFLIAHGIEHLIDNKEMETEYHIAQPQDDWGYNDNVVMDVSKKVIQNINHSKPYFLLIQTLDTHANYETHTPNHGKFDNSWYNTIYNTNIQIYEFIKWLKTQPDYENTVVAIVGDHLRMGNNFPMPKERFVYNLFLNAPKPKNTVRTFSQIDLFPSILEAMGAEIKGHQLGLGISVFSNKKTLLERYPDTLAQKLSKRSKLSEELWKIK